MNKELNETQRLIRLKRYEQPREDYFEDFLVEFQRRQRAEMIQRPIWQIAWERTNLWLESFRVPTVAYVGILMAAAVTTGLIMNSQNSSSSVVLNSPAPVSVTSSTPTNPVQAVSTAPHSYVLEKRPVSYDAPFSF